MASYMKQLEKRRAREKLHRKPRAAKAKPGRGAEPSAAPAESAASRPRTRTYDLAEPPGAKVQIRMPSGFFGTWHATLTAPGHPTVKNTAEVTCTAERRIRARWAENQGKFVNDAMQRAVEQAILELGGAKKVCAA